MICSDKWIGYLPLSSKGYNHRAVNHSKEFISHKEYKLATKIINGRNKKVF